VARVIQLMILYCDICIDVLEGPAAILIAINDNNLL
jgi:hypothetical protein